MTAVQFFLSKHFWKQFALALVVLVALLLLVALSLGFYTKHGDSTNVPNLAGLTLVQAEKLLAGRDLEIEIMDSAFVLDKKPGQILEQDPMPNTAVKSGRTIYVSVNVLHPPKVKMPNLRDASLRQAILLLKSYGLNAGKIIYKPDIANNAVLEMQLNNRPLVAGSLVTKGSSIDLIVGNGLGNSEIPMPNLIGLTFEEAKFVLQSSNLTLGITIFDKDIVDSASAFVYRQSPEVMDAAGDPVNVKLAEPIDLFLSKDPDKSTKQDGSDNIFQ